MYSAFQNGTIAHMSPETNTAPKKTTSSQKKTATKRAAASRVKRKAPTQAHTRSSSRGFPIKLVVVSFGAFVVVSAISVFIGTRDAGIINVHATIEERALLEEAKGNTSLSQTIRSAGNSQTKRSIDDALVGAGNKVTEQQKKEKTNKGTTPKTASSSDASASSTSATSTDGVINEGEDGEDSVADESDVSSSENGDENDSENTDEVSNETDTESAAEEPHADESGGG